MRFDAIPPAVTVAVNARNCGSIGACHRRSVIGPLRDKGKVCQCSGCCFFNVEIHTLESSADAECERAVVKEPSLGSPH